MKKLFAWLVVVCILSGFAVAANSGTSNNARSAQKQPDEKGFTEKVHVKIGKIKMEDIMIDGKERPGLTVYVPFGTAQFAKDMPSKLEVEVDFKDRMAGGWTIHSAIGNVKVGDKGYEPMEFGPYLRKVVVSADKKTCTWPVSLEGLEKNKDYLLRFRLLLNSGDREVVQDTKQRLDMDTGGKMLSVRMLKQP